MKSRLPTGLPRTTTPCSAAGRAQFPVQHGFSGSCGGSTSRSLPSAVPRACLTQVYLDVGMSRQGLAHDGELADRVLRGSRDVDVVEEHIKSVRRVKSSSGLEQRLMLA